MTTHMSPGVARAAVTDTGTKFARVTFTKKDGTTGEVRGLFRPTSKMVGGHGGQLASQRLANNDLIAIWSPDAANKAGNPMRGWRSFYADKVQAIRTGQKTYSVE
jgi:hypothetical protein